MILEHIIDINYIDANYSLSYSSTILVSLLSTRVLRSINKLYNKIFLV